MEDLDTSPGSASLRLQWKFAEGTCHSYKEKPTKRWQISRLSSRYQVSVEPESLQPTGDEESQQPTGDEEHNATIGVEEVITEAVEQVIAIMYGPGYSHTGT